MQKGFTTVPFKINDNFSNIAGVAKFSAAGIVLEFESKLFGIIKNGVKEVRIAIDEILDVKFRKGIFKRGAKIELRTKSFSKLSEMPNKDGKISLKIERDDFQRAEEAVNDLQKDLLYNQGNIPHTPVSRLFDDSEDETKNLEK